MIIAHGPPGAGGVSTLMHVGTDDLSELEGADLSSSIGLATKVAVASWVYGLVTKNEKVKDLGFKASVGLFIAQALTR